METKTKFFIGLDVHKKSTTYAVRNRKGEIIREGECATLYRDLQEQLEPYISFGKIGLESSTSYYTLYQEFLRNKYNIRVANTLQLRRLIQKSDPLDARRLADMLRLGTFPCSHIPDKKVQHMRNIVQLRHALMEEKTRCNNRIQALLDRNGIVMPSKKAFCKTWQNALMQHLGAKNAPLDLRHAFAHYKFLEGEVRQLDQEMAGCAKENWEKEFGLIQSVTGFGPILSCYIIAEVLPIDRFASERKLRRYAGVIPVFLQSGGKTSKGKIPKFASRKLLRWALVQAANACAGSKGTRLAKYYKKKKQKKSSALAKVAVASSLSDILYKVLKNGQPYDSNCENT